MNGVSIWAKGSANCSAAEAGSKETGKGNTNLNGGKELGWFGYHAQQCSGTFVSIFGHTFEFVVVKGDDCDLTHGKECVDQDQYQKDHKVNDKTVTVRVHFFLLFVVNNFDIRMR